MLPIVYKNAPLSYEVKDNQPIDLPWVEVFIPSTVKTPFEEEFADQQKLGGKKLLFFDGEDGEEWPQQDGQDFQLICQFFDPRTGHRLEWVRLFMRNVKDVQDEPGNAFLRRIDLRTSSDNRLDPHV